MEVVDRRELKMIAEVLKIVGSLFIRLLYRANSLLHNSD